MKLFQTISRLIYDTAWLMQEKERGVLMMHGYIEDQVSDLNQTTIWIFIPQLKDMADISFMVLCSL